MKITKETLKKIIKEELENQEEVEDAAEAAQKFADTRSEEEVAKQFSKIMSSLPQDQKDKVIDFLKKQVTEKGALEEVFTPVAASKLGKMRKSHSQNLDDPDYQSDYPSQDKTKGWHPAVGFAGGLGYMGTAGQLSMLGLGAAATTAAMLGGVLLAGSAGYLLFHIFTNN